MAKDKRAESGATGRRRGGRKPGAWTLVTPEALRAWRESQKMSRVRFAARLGVSSGSVQNWETGHAVATTKMQQRLAELINDAGPSIPSAVPDRRSTPARSSTPDTNGAARHPSLNGDPMLIQATASIVVEAVRAGGKSVSAEELGLMVRTVRDALA